MTKQEFFELINGDRKDGYAVYLRHLFDGNDAKVYRLTGLDFTEMFAGRPVTSGIKLNVNKYGKIR